MSTSDDIPRAGLEAEYHADDAWLPAIGVRTGTWTDQSGLGRNLLQANVALQPICADAGGIWAGRKCLRFTAATSEYMETGAFTLSQPCTFVLLARNRAPTVWGVGDCLLTGRASTFGIFSSTTAAAETVIWPGVASLLWNGILGASGYSLCAATFNGASSYCDVNGVRVAGPGGAGALNPTGLTLASLGTVAGGPARYSNIDVFSVLAYSRVLSLEEIAQVTYVLGARYGIDVQQPLREGLRCECYADDASVPAVGSTVASWTDLSGSGNNLLQGGAVGLRPTVVEDGGKSIAFDGADDYLQGAYALVQTHERIGLLRVTDAAPLTTRSQWDGTTVNRGQLQIEDAGAGVLASRIQSGAILSGAGYAARDRYSIIDALYSGGNSALYEDGETRAGVGNAGANAPAGATLGANATPAEWSNCRYKAFLDYNRGITANERTRVQLYLRRRFGLNGSLPIPSFGLQAAYLWEDLPAVGSLVAAWTDRSIYGRGLTAAGAARPTVADVGDGRRRCALFDGVANTMTTAAFALAQPNTVYVVCRATSNTGVAGKGITDGLVAVTRYLYRDPGPPTRCGVYAGGAGAVLSTYYCAHPDWTILTPLFNGASSFLLDNEIIVGGPVNIGAPAASGITLGSAGGAVNFWDGAIMAALYYSVIHTAAERARVLAFLHQYCGV